MYNYFFFGSDSTQLAECSNILGQPVHSFQNPKKLLRASQLVLPHFIVFDYHMLSQNTLRLLTQVRIQNPAACIPFIILVELNTLESAEQEALFHFPQSIVISPAQLKTHLSMQLEMILEAHFTDRPEGNAHPYALEVLARVWRQGLNGNLVLIETEQTTRIFNGGISTIDGYDLIRKGLYGDGFRFYETEEKGLGDWLSVGDILWEAANSRTEVGFLKTRMNLELVPTTFSARYEDLEIPSIIHPLLKQTENQSLRSALKSNAIRHTQVEKFIEALYLLGLYTFRLLPPAQPQTQEAILLTPENPTISKLQYRLNLELSAFQQLDEWRIIGLTPTINTIQIQNAVQERREPYVHWSQSADSINARQMAYKLLQIIDEATTCAIELAQCYRSFGHTSVPNTGQEVLFQSGHRALLQRRYTDAFSCFQEAINLNLMSARLMSYAGWSAFHVGHYTLALEQLDIARVHAPRHPFVLRCFALVNIQLNNIPLAKSAISIMIKHQIDVEHANQLQKIVERHEVDNQNDRLHQPQH